LPDAYAAAPYPVSVLLAGIVTKVCGIYTLIRLVVSVFGFAVGVNSIILIAGAVSLVSAGIAALGQGDLRRMLAYSSISQMGFILLGLGSGTELGIIGAAFHFFNHAVFKTLLFVNSAAIGLRTGTTKIEELEGLSYKMPVTGLTSVIAFLSAGGLPPLAGFWSKLIIIVALWSSGRYAYAVIAGLSSVITLAYFLLMQRKIFFSKAKQGLEYVTEVNLGFSVLSILLAAIAIGAGVLFPYVYNLLFRPVGAIFYL